jgi:sulfatase maturation enzyme AslB (radical SAM superfamily)
LTYIIWHGGEPLLMSDEYFHEVFAIQAEILGEYRTQFRNALQTNLFKLTEKKTEII